MIFKAPSVILLLKLDGSKSPVEFEMANRFIYDSGS